MNEKDNRIIDKIEKLIALSGSANENEAKAAMLKARELMAKYEIETEQLNPGSKKERPVVSYTSPSFRDDWVVDLSCLIAENLRCRSVLVKKTAKGATFRIRFFGFEEDAKISVNVFNYAVKVIRKRLAVLQGIYRMAEREFGRNEKMNYVDGFCSGLQQNFEEQKNQSKSFALALLVPEEVDAFVDNITGLESVETPGYERRREHGLLQRYGYMDGMNFRNAGDKEQLEYGY